jgi:polysaccharide biosynthesis protein PslG
MAKMVGTTRRILSRGGMPAACLAALFAVLAAPQAVPSASASHLTDSGSPESPTTPWGFSDDWGWQDGAFTSDLASQQVHQGATILPDGLTANRFLVQWADVEAQHGTYDWTRSDAVYAAMQQHAPGPVLMLYNAPGWARDPAATCPSENPCAYPPLAEYDADWQRFVAAAVRRYPDVRAIEIWNEPNLARFWAPSADAERFAALLDAAHDAVETANVTAPVIVGGLVPASTSEITSSPSSFMRELYSLGAAENFDGIGAHPYPFNAPYVETMWKRLDALLTVRDEAGDSAPLWITEVGISTDPGSGASIEGQGPALTSLYRSIEGHAIASFIIHRLYDISAESSFWNQTGIISAGGIPKPAYCELGQAIGTPCVGASTTPQPPQPEPGASVQPQVGDSSAPKTIITKQPKAKSKDKTPTFEFAASEPGSIFLCSFDGEPLTPCTSPETEKVGKGMHEFDVIAVDQAGNRDATPAEDSFKVKKK